MKRVFRLFYNSDECFLVEIFKSDDNGESADKLGNDAVFYYVVSDNVLINAALNLFLFRAFICVEAYLLRALTLFDYGFNSVKCASADEENVFSIYLYKFLVRVLSSALGWNVCHSTL